MPMVALAWLVAVPVVAATPAERLLGPLMAELTQPQRRCEWAGAQLDDVERELSLYRAAMSSLAVQLDGVRLADTGDALLSTTFERRLLGPATVTAVLDAARLTRRMRVGDGQRLEVSFEDADGEVHPLFCGIVFASTRNERDGTLEVRAVRPRPGDERQNDRSFFELRRADVVRQLALESGLQVEVRDTRSRPVSNAIVQRRLADWIFMRRLAAEENMELTLGPDVMLYANSTFSAPAVTVPDRTFAELTWIEMIEVLAGEMGLVADVQETRPFPQISARQGADDLRFAHDLAARHERSAYPFGDKLLVRDDGHWRRNPSLRRERWTASAVDIARAIAARHRLPISAGRLRYPMLRARQHDQTDSEFLLSILAANGLRLVSADGRLEVRRATHIGAATDLLLLRATVSATGSRRAFSRTHGDVRAALMAPLDVPGTRVHLELGRARHPVGEAAFRLLATEPAGSASSLPARDAGDAARTLQEQLAEARPGAASSARESFLLDLVQVYRPTVLFLRTASEDPE